MGINCGGLIVNLTENNIQRIVVYSYSYSNRNTVTENEIKIKIKKQLRKAAIIDAPFPWKHTRGTQYSNNSLPAYYSLLL